MVLFITAYVDTEKAVRAIKAGATDFIAKPWDNAKLLGIVKSAVKLSLSRKGILTDSPLHTSTPLIGESPQMLTLKKYVGN